MNWVRINNTLPDSPKIIALARMLDCSFNEALGIAVRWLCWLDVHTTDGKSGLHRNEVDDFICIQAGAANALESIGWVKEDAEGLVCAVDFDAYCSPSAKAKTLAAARQKKSRLLKKTKEKLNK